MGDNRYEDGFDRPFIEKFSQMISMLVIGVMTVYTAMSWSAIPQIIVTHFGAGGTPDGFGSKWTLLLFPAIMIVLFIAMKAMSKFPQAYNYPVKVTEENKAVQYALARSFIYVLLLEVTVLMGYIQWAIVSGAVKDQLVFDPLIVIVLVVLLLVSVAGYVYRAIKNK